MILNCQKIGEREIEMKGWGKMTNCPNCGAPITKRTCEYCGTVFVDPYKEQISQLEQEILSVKNDILLSAYNDAIISANTWRNLLGKMKGFV